MNNESNRYNDLLIGLTDAQSADASAFGLANVYAIINGCVMDTYKKFRDLNLGEQFVYGRDIYTKCRKDKAMCYSITCGREFFNFKPTTTVRVMEELV